MVIIWLSMVNNNLVGGIPTPLEKYELVNEKDDIQYMKWKIIQMFQTTNLILYLNGSIYLNGSMNPYQNDFPDNAPFWEYKR